MENFAEKCKEIPAGAGHAVPGTSKLLVALIFSAGGLVSALLFIASAWWVSGILAAAVPVPFAVLLLIRSPRRLRSVVAAHLIVVTGWAVVALPLSGSFSSPSWAWFVSIGALGAVATTCWAALAFPQLLRLRHLVAEAVIGASTGLIFSWWAALEQPSPPVSASAITLLCVGFSAWQGGVGSYLFLVGTRKGTVSSNEFSLEAE